MQTQVHKLTSELRGTQATEDRLPRVEGYGWPGTRSLLSNSLLRDDERWEKLICVCMYSFQHGSICPALLAP